MLSMKSETRVIRPFSGASNIRGYLNDAELHLCENDIDARKENRIIVDFDFDELPVVKPNLSEIELKKIEEMTGIGREKFQIAVWMTVPSAKKFRVLKTVVGNDLTNPEGFSISSDIFDAAKRRHGAEVSIALVLSDELDEVPLRPSTYAQWLVKKDFKVSLYDEESNKIDLQELTEDVRVRFNLPEQAAYFVDMSESAFLTEADGNIRGAMTIYLDADTLQRLRRGTKSSEAVQKIILGEVIPRLIIESIKRAEIGQFSELDSGSPLHNLFRQLGEATKRRPSDVFDVATKHPERLPTYVQAVVGTVSAIKEMI